MPWWSGYFFKGEEETVNISAGVQERGMAHEHIQGMFT